MAELLRKDLYYCKACPSSFSRYTKLKCHMASHTIEENIVYGDIFTCTWSSPKKQVKQVKQAEHHCLVCHKRYLHSGYYKKHLWNAHNIHVKSIPDPIRQSEKLSDECRGLAKFVRGRRRDRTPITTECRKRKYYECSVCRKTMTQPSSLKAHKRIHTGERPYQCPICSKTFTFYQCLWNHSWSHKDKNSFPCDKCPKKFRYYQTLWTHYKIHTDDKPFACGMCKLRFTNSSHLMYHMKEHPEYLKAKIKSCGNRDLMTSDVNEMPFMCEICCKSFRLKVSLTSHMEKCHSFSSATKPQISFQNKVKCVDFSLRRNSTGPAQKPKRGPGRPTKHIGLEEGKKIVNSKQCKILSKLYQICPGPAQKPKRVHGRPRKYVGLEEVKEKVDSKQCKIPMTLHPICPGPAQKPKRGRGRPRKYARLEEVNKKINSKQCKLPMKLYHICPNCNKISTYCVCNTVLNAEQVCKPSHSTHEFNGKSQVHHPQCENGTSFDKNARISDENIFPKLSLRRSRRLRGQRMMVLECKTCLGLTSASKPRERLKHHVRTNLYKCQHCSKSYKYKSWLSRHQYLEHRDTQKDTFKKDRLKKKLYEESTCTCSFCGTKFLSCNDYKDHSVCQSCTCGQQFQCAFVFCSHVSKCSEDNAIAWEGITNQNHESGDSTVIFCNEESVCDDLMNQSRNNLATEELQEVSQMITDEFPKDIETNYCLLSSATSADFYQSEGWCMQLISDSFSSKDSSSTATIDQAKQNSLSDAEIPLLAPQDPWFVPQDPLLASQYPLPALQESLLAPQDPLFVPEDSVPAPQDPLPAPQDQLLASQDPLPAPQDPLLASQDPLLASGSSKFNTETSGISVFNSNVKSCKELDYFVEADQKSIGIKQNCQCILCGQQFSSLSELTTHRTNHVSDQENLG